MGRGVLFDEDGEIASYGTVADAVIVAIHEMKNDGGGVVWVHRPQCDGIFEDNPDCPCYPVPIPVEPDDAN